MNKELVQASDVWNLIIYFAIALVLSFAAIGAYTWLKGRSRKNPMDDVDWDKEKERFIHLADVAKAKRNSGENQEGGKEKCEPKKG